jgi:hypothetical protein
MTEVLHAYVSSVAILIGYSEELEAVLEGYRPEEKTK